MKTLLYSLTFLSLSILKLQAQVAFPTDGAIWVNTEYTYTFNPPNPVPDSELTDVENYCVNGQDTTILGNDYTKVFYCGDTYKGALREENSIVYFVPANSTDEYLLYDFGAQVGQTLQDVYVGNHYDETFMLQDFTVQQTGTEIIGGVSRRVVWADSYRWIEGIGCETGLFMEPWANVSMYAVFLECMSVNGITLFPVEGNNACPLTVGVNEATSQTMSIEIYPNPTKESVTVNTGTPTSMVITILDIQGREIQNAHYPQTDKAQFEIEGQPGVYFIRVKTEDERARSFRIVKN